MIEIKFSGSPPYQLKVRDLSSEGAGIVVRPDSKLLKMIEIGQELNIRLVLPRDYRGPSGHFRSIIEHITQIHDGPFRGHMVVGLSFLTRITSG